MTAGPDDPRHRRDGWRRWQEIVTAAGAGLAFGLVAGYAAGSRHWLPGALAKDPVAAAALAVAAGVLAITGATLWLTAANGRQLKRLLERGAAAGTPRVEDGGGWAAPTAGLLSSSWKQEEAAARPTLSTAPGRDAGGAPPSSRRPAAPAGDIGGAEPLGSSFGDGAGSRPWPGDPPASWGSRPPAPPDAGSPGRFRMEDLTQSAGQPTADGSAAASSPVAERLVAVWQRYLDDGDGRFEPGGLGRQLEAAGLSGRVVKEPSLGEHVLGVDLGDGRIYLLPHFNSTPRAVADWFEARSPAPSRLARIQRLCQVAVGHRVQGGRVELCSKGAVE